MLGEGRHNPLVGQNWEAKIRSSVVPMPSGHVLLDKGTDPPPASIITVCSPFLLVALLSALWSAHFVLISLNTSPLLGLPRYPYVSRYSRHSRYYRHSVRGPRIEGSWYRLGHGGHDGSGAKRWGKAKTRHSMAPEKRSQPCSFLSNFQPNPQEARSSACLRWMVMRIYF